VQQAGQRKHFTEKARVNSSAFPLNQSKQWKAKSNRVDDLSLSATQGLEMVPTAIRMEGARATAFYLLDLFASPKPRLDFSSQLILLGPRESGKTSLIDSLFPFRLSIELGKGVKKEYHLTGSILKISTYFDHTFFGSVEIDLTEANTRCTVVSESALEIIQFSGTKHKLDFESKEQATQWRTRIEKYFRQNRLPSIDLELKRLQSPLAAEDANSPRELSLIVWDLPPFPEFFNNLHCLLHSNSVFMVIWRMKEGAQGIESLKSLLSPLSCRIPSPDGQKKGISNVKAIFVVGTFLDHPSVPKGPEAEGNRREKIQELARQCKIGCPLVIKEVSSVTKANLKELEASLYQTLISSDVAFNLPSSYVEVESALDLLRDKSPAFPVARMSDLINLVQGLEGKEGKEGKGVQPEVIQRALHLLSQQGKCLSIADPASGSMVLVMISPLLLKEAIHNLTLPREGASGTPARGMIHHKDLKSLWGGFHPAEDKDFFLLAEALTGFLKQLDVCFVVEEDKNKEFLEQRSLFPCLLPPSLCDKSEFWQTACPGEWYEVTKTFQGTAPLEEIPFRLFSRLHSVMREQRIWREGMFFDYSMMQALVQVDKERREISLVARGREEGHALAICEVVEEEISSLVLHYPGISFSLLSSLSVPPASPPPDLDPPVWRWVPHKKWEPPNPSSPSLMALCVAKDGAWLKKTKAEAERALELFTLLSIRLKQVAEAHALFNQHLLIPFERFLQSLEAKLAISPDYFHHLEKQEGNKSLSNHIHHFQEFVSQFPWNTLSKVSLLLFFLSFVSSTRAEFLRFPFSSACNAGTSDPDGASHRCRNSLGHCRDRIRVLVPQGKGKGKERGEGLPFHQQSHCPWVSATLSCHVAFLDYSWQPCFLSLCFAFSFSPPSWFSFKDPFWFIFLTLFLWLCS